jgi:hypothetical protein
VTTLDHDPSSEYLMTGRAYYKTTLGAWHRYAQRFANSHWLALNDGTPPNEATNILVLIEADEGAHLLLEDDREFEGLPHPLTQKAISHESHVAIAASSLATVAPDATTFEVAEAAAKIHPLLGHRVF